MEFTTGATAARMPSMKDAAEPRITQAAQLERELEMTLKMALNVRDTSTAIEDRMVGARPRPETTGANQPIGPGVLAQTVGRLAAIQQILNDAHDNLGRVAREL